MAGHPPITRNLTSIFVRYRHDRRNARAGLLGFVGEQTGQRLLGKDADSRGAGVGVEMVETSLPPQWTDSAEEAREDIKQIRDKLVQLTKSQHKRLLKVFVDDGAPDRDVEAVTNQISALIRRCEQHIHHVKTRGADRDASQKEAQTRENVQRNLATQLQQLSQMFRKHQKDYLQEIRKRQRGGVWDDGPSETVGKDGGGDIGFSDGQLQELEAMEVDAGRRSQEICQIASSINDLHTIFKELAVLVIDQGSILDRIDYNIEQVVHQSVEANKQLQKAEKSQKSNRAMKCILVLVVIDLILILILVIKARH